MAMWVITRWYIYIYVWVCVCGCVECFSDGFNSNHGPLGLFSESCGLAWWWPGASEQATAPGGRTRVFGSFFGRQHFDFFLLSEEFSHLAPLVSCSKSSITTYSSLYTTCQAFNHHMPVIRLVEFSSENSRCPLVWCRRWLPGRCYQPSPAKTWCQRRERRAKYGCGFALVDPAW